MAFRDFTLLDALQKLGLILDERSLFSAVAERTPSDGLREALAEGTPLALAINNEKARSELLISPILVEVRRALAHRISLFSGVELTVDDARGLSGTSGRTAQNHAA